MPTRRRSAHSRTLGRRAQNPSKLIGALIFLVILVGLSVVALLANTELLSIIEEHNQNRVAILVATRITGASDFVMDAGYYGMHKNVLDSRKLDKYSWEFIKGFLGDEYAGSLDEPYLMRTKCYNWAAVIKAPDLDRVWVFGDRDVFSEIYTEPLEGQAYLARDEGRKYMIASYSQTGYSADFSAMTENLGGYTIPVAIAMYEGDQVREYQFGTLQVSVKKGTECMDQEKLEEEYAITIELLNKFYESPRTMIGATSSGNPYGEPLLPYLARSDRQRNVLKYFRCEELPFEKISEHFTLSEAIQVDGMKGLVSSDGTALTEKLEEVASREGIDPNFLRAVLFYDTGLAQSYISSIDIDELGRSLRADIDTFSGSVAAAQCIPNYVALSRLVGSGETQQYISGTLAPSPETRREAERIVYYYNEFSACWDLEGGLGNGS